MYETGLPALRIEHNVVRVPVGLALTAVGIGAFTIVNNLFSSGELVERATASTVEVANLGVALELARPATNARALYSTSVAAPTALGRTPIGSASDGAVLFTDNICQVRASAQSPTATSSVLIISLDHLCSRTTTAGWRAQSTASPSTRCWSARRSRSSRTASRRPSTRSSCPGSPPVS